MKRSVFLCLCLVITGIGYAQEEQVVEITSFEEPEATAFSGGQTVFSMVDEFNEMDNVEPYDGDWHVVMEYDTSIDVWGFADLDLAEPVDLTGMREVHMWVYFLDDVQPNEDGVYELRFSIDGDVTIDLGYKSQEVAGEWVKYVWEIDDISSQNLLSSVTGFNMSFMPGEDNATGLCFIDNVFAVRPEGFPEELEYVQVYDFDEEDDNAAPVGWEAMNVDVFIGVGDIEPSEGENYMEIYLGEWWQQDAITTNAKEATDLWAEATDIILDVYVSEDFDGSWLLMNPVVQSGGEDEDGNPLEPTNGWDSYGERDIRWGGPVGEWWTVAWPFRAYEHLGALEHENGWFQVILVTNQDAAQAGKKVYVDNFRLAVPKEPTEVKDWSLF